MLVYTFGFFNVCGIPFRAPSSYSKSTPPRAVQQSRRASVLQNDATCGMNALALAITNLDEMMV